MTGAPVCILAGEEASLTLKPRLVIRPGEPPAFVIDAKICGNRDAAVAAGISLRDLHKLESFMTEVYDWRRLKLYGVRR